LPRDPSNELNDWNVSSLHFSFGWSVSDPRRFYKEEKLFAAPTQPYFMEENPKQGKSLYAGRKVTQIDALSGPMKREEKSILLRSTISGSN